MSVRKKKSTADGCCDRVRQLGGPQPTTVCIAHDQSTNVDGLPRDGESFYKMSVAVPNTPPFKLHGRRLLKSKYYNKNLAFTYRERQLLGVHGLMPGAVETLRKQLRRCLHYLQTLTHDRDKLAYLWRLENVNVRLFYGLLAHNPEYFFRLLSSAVMCECFTHMWLFGCVKGVYITIRDRGHVYEILKNWPERHVLDIYVSDGQAFYGAVDVGANAMAMCVNCLSMHTLYAGIRPQLCLPVLLDVGTDNAQLLADPLYCGVPARRQSGAAYLEFIEEFVLACVRRFGTRALIQFEAFSLEHSLQLLRRYRLSHCCLNVEIECSGAGVLAGIIASEKITKVRLQDNVVLLYGRHCTIYGTARLLVSLLKSEGMNETDAYARIWLCDETGVSRIKQPRAQDTRLQSDFAQFAHDCEPIDTLEQAVQIIKPTVLVGCSGHKGAFSKAVLNAMEQLNAMSIIFALSLPVSNAECSMAEAFAYTRGKCIFVSAAVLPPFTYANRTYTAGQNKTTVLSAGIAAGVTLSGMRLLSDEVFIVAAQRLADLVTPSDLERKCIYPSIKNSKCCAMQIAEAIMLLAYRRRSATLWPEPPNRLAYIKQQFYDYKYKSAVNKKYGMVPCCTSIYKPPMRYHYQHKVFRKLK